MRIVDWFPIVTSSLLLAIGVCAFCNMIADDRERGVRRRTANAAYLGRVGILLAMDAPSLEGVELNQHRRNKYVAKRAGLWPWKVAA